jgi:hypothetical protein
MISDYFPDYVIFVDLSVTASYQLKMINNDKPQKFLRMDDE